VLAFEEIFVSFVPPKSCLFLVLGCKGARYFCCAAGSSPPAAGKRQASQHSQPRRMDVLHMTMELSFAQRQLRLGKYCHSTLGQLPPKKFDSPTRKICYRISGLSFAHSSIKSLQ